MPSNELKIAAIPGDGIGAEVVAAGVRVLDAVGRRYQLAIDVETFDWGSERYLKPAR